MKTLKHFWLLPLAAAALLLPSCETGAGGGGLASLGISGGLSISPDGTIGVQFGLRPPAVISAPAPAAPVVVVAPK